MKKYYTINEAISYYGKNLKDFILKEYKHAWHTLSDTTLREAIEKYLEQGRQRTIASYKKHSSRYKNPIGRLKKQLPDRYFDFKDLQIGARVEMEHTGDWNTAKLIAKAHLTEDKDYYRKLYKMEYNKNPQGGQMYILYARGEHYPVNEKGQITREGSKDFSGQWTLYALVPKWNMHPRREYKWAELKKKLDKGEQLSGYVFDIDHGTVRYWGGQYAGKLPKADLYKVYGGNPAKRYKEIGGESYYQVLQQQQAIETSRTPEEAVKKLKRMGYVSTFRQSRHEPVETIEELVDRVWSLYKDPANRQENPMHKQQYTLIAQTLVNIFNSGQFLSKQEKLILEEFEEMLANDNPNFKKNKFEDYIVKKLVG